MECMNISVPFHYVPDTFNLLRSRRNRRHLKGDFLKSIFLKEHAWIAFKISLKLDPKVWVNNTSSLVQTMAWRRPGNTWVHLLTIITKSDIRDFACCLNFCHNTTVWIFRIHDDVIKWKHFPRYWPFVREFTGHRWIPRRKQVTQNFDVFFDLRLN